MGTSRISCCCSTCSWILVGFLPQQELPSRMYCLWVWEGAFGLYSLGKLRPHNIVLSFLLSVSSSASLKFWIPCIKAAVQQLSLPVWLVSLSLMPRGSSTVSHWAGFSAFSWLRMCHYMMCISHPLSFYPLTDTQAVTVSWPLGIRLQRTRESRDPRGPVSISLAGSPAWRWLGHG